MNVRGTLVLSRRKELSPRRRELRVKVFFVVRTLRVLFDMICVVFIQLIVFRLTVFTAPRIHLV